MNPISKCVICGKPIVKMRKRLEGPGLSQYRLEWRRAKYCSNACAVMAHRRRKRAEAFKRIFGD
jgi:predicted nucleic acid-binding Zn ribbon protein